MKLDLPSLVYHDREWFVFRQVVSHLPKEKAALADKRSKENRKYTSRLGISKDWVVGERKVKLIQNGFIEDVVLDTPLVFSNILIVRENFEELLCECFSRPLTVNVEQFTLTEKLFVVTMFEWNYDPKQSEPIKQTKITHTDQSSPAVEKKQAKKEKISPTPQLKSSPLKRRRSTLLKRKAGCEDSEYSSGTDLQSSDLFSIPVSENVLSKPKRKKAKEATDLTNTVVENGTNGVTENKIEQDTTCTSTTSPEAENKTLCLEQDNQMEISSAVCTLATNTASKEKSPIKDMPKILLSLPVSDYDNLLLMENNEKGHEINNEGNCETQIDCPVNEQIEDINISPTVTLTPVYSSLDLPEPTQSSDTTTNDSVMLNLSSVNGEPTSPSILIQNLKRQEKQLCPEIDDVGSDMSTCKSIDPVDGEEKAESVGAGVGEVESPCTNNEENIGHHTDHNENCTASVCSCPHSEFHSEETSETVGNIEGKVLLNGLIAAGLVSQVRELLINFNCGDKETKLSQMEHEIKTLQKQICQQNQANEQMEKNVKKKAKELEKSFDDLKAGKAHRIALEKKCQAVQTEKIAVEAKLKKCLEVLSSIG